MRPQQPNFKLTRQAILLGIISAAYPMAGYCAAAGRADFVIGNVEAVAADGSRRPLVKGSEVNTGDAINTAAGARAQVRFNDGGYVSLQPNTVFRVDQFNYQNQTDGNEKGFFSLLKGGLRAITGAIGHVNRETYKVATPNATIGIRGTGYKAEIRDDGLFVSVGEGAISLTNNVGLLVVTAGNAAFVANPNTPPEPSRQQPAVPPAPLQPLTPASSIIQPTLPSMASGPGYVMAYAYMYQPSVTMIGGSSQIGVNNPLNAVFTGTSQLTQFSSLDGSGGIGSAAVTFSATDGIIGWGRWIGNNDPTSTIPGAMTPGTFDYIIGIPTAIMPTTGTATYSLMGYTNPTATDGSTGYTVNASLNVNFQAGASPATVTMNMTVANSTTSYSITNGTMFISGATFSGTGLATTGTGSGFPCSSGCSTSVNGFFAGANASRAGLSYTVTEFTIPNTKYVQGVAAFAKQ